MDNQDQKEVLKQEMEERMTRICQMLMKLAKDYKMDVFLAINAPQLGIYEHMSQIQRLATIQRLIADLETLRSHTSSWLDAGLMAGHEQINDSIGEETP